MQLEKLWFTATDIWIQTTDNRTSSLQLSLFKKFKNATDQQLNAFELWDDKRWIHWEELGEDLSVDGFFNFNMAHAK